MSAQKDPVVRAAVDAINRSSLEGFMQLFSHDPIINDSGAEYRGFAEVEKWASHDIFNVHGRLTVEGGSGEASNVVHGNYESQGGYNGPSVWIFRILGGKVAHLEIQ